MQKKRLNDCLIFCECFSGTSAGLVFSGTSAGKVHGKVSWRENPGKVPGKGTWKCPGKGSWTKNPGKEWITWLFMIENANKKMMRPLSSREYHQGPLNYCLCLHFAYFCLFLHELVAATMRAADRQSLNRLIVPGMLALTEILASSMLGH